MGAQDSVWMFRTDLQPLKVMRYDQKTMEQGFKSPPNEPLFKLNEMMEAPVQ